MDVGRATRRSNRDGLPSFVFNVACLNDAMSCDVDHTSFSIARLAPDYFVVLMQVLNRICAARK